MRLAEGQVWTFVADLAVASSRADEGAEGNAGHDEDEKADYHGPGSGGGVGRKRVSQVRLLVGTRKGAFVLTSDGTRNDWSVSGPHFAGWEIYHLKGSPADPNR